MDESENRERCPFPQPIKEDHTETDSAWQAKESSYPFLRFVRVTEKQRQQRQQRQKHSNVSLKRKKNKS